MGLCKDSGSLTGEEVLGDVRTEEPEQWSGRALIYLSLRVPGGMQSA